MDNVLFKKSHLRILVGAPIASKFHLQQRSFLFSGDNYYMGVTKLLLLYLRSATNLSSAFKWINYSDFVDRTWELLYYYSYYPTKAISGWLNLCLL